MICYWNLSRPASLLPLISTFLSTVNSSGWYIHREPFHWIAENVSMFYYKVGELCLRFLWVFNRLVFFLLPFFILEMSMSFCSSSVVPSSSNTRMSLKCHPWHQFFWVVIRRFVAIVRYRFYFQRVYHFSSVAWVLITRQGWRSTPCSAHFICCPLQGPMFVALNPYALYVALLLHVSLSPPCFYTGASSLFNCLNWRPSSVSILNFFGS